MRISALFLLFAFTGMPLLAEDGHSLWLRNKSTVNVTVVCQKSSPTLSIAIDELKHGWQGKDNGTVVLLVKKDKAISNDGFRITADGIQANTDLGILYGVYELMRRQQTGEPVVSMVSNPSYEVRTLNHWDNPDGTIERGYAGYSIFWRKGDDSLTVTDADRLLWKEYARASASVGINGAVLNNVNASPLILTVDYLARVKAIADVLRPYGIKVYLSVKFSSPSQIGGLKTSDPLDPQVIKWWQDKIKEIYAAIPDFGGFLVKASSEGQPGPQDYGRTHADGANMMADALKPFGGIIMWRAFVYSPNDQDRAKQAYTEFMPLDGQFHDNIIIQAKNGPVDFQPREPFSPLFGAMKKTPVMAELQITQEYLGQSVHLVFLAPMWEECLKSETYQEGPGSTVARCTDGSIYQQKHTGIAGVANIGLDRNWCGHPFAQANWYAFGRLAWDNTLTSDKIADEWIKLTFSQAPAGQAVSTLYTTEWSEQFLEPVKEMMLQSREAAVNYMMPLGFHHLFAANEHYGPGPWWAPRGVRHDWTPPYYHKADTGGVGFDRTASGSNAVSQYHEPLGSQFNDLTTCPDRYLLWFHRLPWDYVMRSGHTLWDEICFHYDKGVQQVRDFQKTWDRAEPYVDKERFALVQRKLRSQCANAQVWKDACLLYFQQFSRMPFPYDIERPVHELDELIKADMRRR
ncbi:MAG TPA: alpha-glucuronidase [Bacteroidales bacterium]|jgi:alpha-glucuronidase|nr:alpha-glucuronidase [Bacteroidales bacterium]HNT93556.1 alpha-glucuronidase [Bacteroidales bacterium]HOO66113.1 alpha-glucuronidase [Bacteroidales bacterium]HPE22289.1 alpha-glucuronidase [Bacteroidales bacterium]HPJ04337.1 alpha-glucuronidase [Bacteroidales bacterium]